MLNILYVFLGGGLGSLLRYAISLSSSYEHLSFLPPPRATLLTNMLSCIILGFFIGMNQQAILSDRSKLLFMTGFCGGFSTFSTFSSEIVQLLQSGEYVSAAAYLVLSVVSGIVLILVGAGLARQIFL